MSAFFSHFIKYRYSYFNFFLYNSLLFSIQQRDWNWQLKFILIAHITNANIKELENWSSNKFSQTFFFFSRINIHNLRSYTTYSRLSAHTDVNAVEGIKTSSILPSRVFWKGKKDNRAIIGLHQVEKERLFVNIGTYFNGYEWLSIVRNS